MLSIFYLILELLFMICSLTVESLVKSQNIEVKARRQVKRADPAFIYLDDYKPKPHRLPVKVVKPNTYEIGDRTYRIKYNFPGDLCFVHLPARQIKTHTTTLLRDYPEIESMLDGGLLGAIADELGKFGLLIKLNQNRS